MKKSDYTPKIDAFGNPIIEENQLVSGQSEISNLLDLIVDSWNEKDEHEEQWTPITDIRDPAYGHATHELPDKGYMPTGMPRMWHDPQNPRWLGKN